MIVVVLHLLDLILQCTWTWLTACVCKHEIAVVFQSNCIFVLTFFPLHFNLVSCGFISGHNIVITFSMFSYPVVQHDKLPEQFFFIQVHFQCSHFLYISLFAHVYLLLETWLLFLIFEDKDFSYQEGIIIWSLLP